MCSLGVDSDSGVSHQQLDEGHSEESNGDCLRKNLKQKLLTFRDAIFWKKLNKFFKKSHLALNEIVKKKLLFILQGSSDSYLVPMDTSEEESLEDDLDDDLYSSDGDLDSQDDDL